MKKPRPKHSSHPGKQQIAPGARLQYQIGPEIAKRARNRVTREVNDPGRLQEAMQHFAPSIHLFPENPDALSARSGLFFTQAIG